MRPYLVPIGERAETIVNRYKERQISTQEALEQLQLELDEVDELQRQRREPGLSSEGPAGLFLLQRDGVEKAVEVAKEMAAAFESYPHWRTSAEQDRQLRKALYKSVLTTGTDHFEVVVIGHDFPPNQPILFSPLFLLAGECQP